MRSPVHTFSALALAMTVAAGGAVAQSGAPTKAARTPVRRTYKADLPPALVKKAHVAEAAAATTALAKVPGGKIRGVELEEEGGKLIYSYDILVLGKKGVEEVHVDAMTGAVIKTEHEDEPAKPAAKKPPR